MVDENYVRLSGIVKYPPKISIENDGHYRANVTLECLRYDINRNTDNVVVTIAHKDQHDVYMYGALACTCKELVARGSHILVTGFLKSHRWIDFETGDQEFRSEITAVSLEILNPLRTRKTHDAMNDELVNK